jgi:ribulose-phosphate 3-epimerase
MVPEIRITPSILNADFDHLNSEIEKISKVSDLLHLDVMDNVFVPNFTFDFEAAAEIIANSALPVDAHLMVADVDQIAVEYADLGCTSVTVHAEATRNIRQTLRNIRSEGARAGLGIKPGTQVEVYEEFINEIDMFLIMTVEPGFGGQKFMEEMMPKVARTKQIIGDRPIWLQVDGGISMSTIENALDAGADTFVVGSAVFNDPDPASMVEKIRKYAFEHLAK